MKSTLLTLASVSTLANAVTLGPIHNHMAQLKNKGTNAIQASATNARRRREDHLSQAEEPKRTGRLAESDIQRLVQRLAQAGSLNFQEEDDDYYGYGYDFDEEGHSTPDELGLLNPYYAGESKYENEDEKEPEQPYFPSAPYPYVDRDQGLIPEDPVNDFIPDAPKPDP